MESLKDIKYEEKLNLLRMMYPDLKDIHTEYGTLYSSKVGNRIIIIDINGTILLESNTTDCELYGRYLVSVSNYKATVLNLFNNISKEIKLQSYVSAYFEEIHSILKISQNSDITLINNELEIIWEMDYTDKFGFSYEDSKGYWYYYRSRETKYQYRKIRINKFTHNIDIYDSIDICDNYTLIGTELELLRYNKGASSIILDRLSNIKYKLCLNGAVLSDNSYNDILKTKELENSEYFYCYIIKGNHKFIGVLNGKCEEVIPPQYVNISYFNSDNFIVDDGNMRQIINVKSGYKGELVNKNYSFIHSTLPLYITVENNEYMVYDILGRRFKLTDFAKYFKCEYCLHDTDKIRVDLDLYNTGNVRYKYITKNLEPISDTRLINYLSTLEWVNM